MVNLEIDFVLKLTVMRTNITKSLNNKGINRFIIFYIFSR